MNSMPWWANVIGEVVLIAFVFAVMGFMSWLKDETIPLWGWYLGASIGVILWTRPSYNRHKDFDK